MLRRLLASNTVDVIVVSPHTVERSVRDEIIKLLGDFPYTRTVLYVAPHPGLAGVAVSLGRNGLTDVIVQGYDDSPDRFRKIFDSLRDRDVIDSFLDHITPAFTDYPPRLQRAIIKIVEEPAMTKTIGQVAADVGVSEATVYRSLKRAGLGSWRAFVKACRVLRAYAALREHGYSVATVARQVGYNAPRDLSRDTNIVLGCRPRDFARDTRYTPDAVIAMVLEWLSTAGNHVYEES